MQHNLIHYTLYIIHARDRKERKTATTHCRVTAADMLLQKDINPSYFTKTLTLSRSFPRGIP